jgi:NAD(P)-dependent dehydrogenase (short-subunit alcohol dehydrogenase family)
MVTGKLAIVTGGARGIGAGIARVLASQGARVAILDLDLAEAEKTAASLAMPGIAVAAMRPASTRRPRPSRSSSSDSAGSTSW